MVIDHTFSPTATFKGLHDAAGGDAKRAMRDLELREVPGCRANCARSVQTALDQHMAQPVARDLDTCNLFSLTTRHHILVVDRSRALPADLASDAEKVLVVDCEGESWDCSTVPGIQSAYNLRATPPPPGHVAGPDRSVQMRDHPCACRDCVQRHPVCPLRAVTGTWKKKDMHLKAGVLPRSPGTGQAHAAEAVEQGGFVGGDDSDSEVASERDEGGEGGGDEDEDEGEEDTTGPGEEGNWLLNGDDPDTELDQIM
jgi:hypothetical protein